MNRVRSSLRHLPLLLLLLAVSAGLLYGCRSLTSQSEEENEQCVNLDADVSPPSPLLVVGRVVYR